jgi:tRNA-specific 2-thiouridylase
MATRFGFAVARKPDSQDFAAGGYRSLVGVGAPGPIVDRQGNVLGQHRGLAQHTVGQRKGLGIAAGRPLYVTGLDPVRNAVVVGERSDVFQDTFIVSGVNWTAIDGLEGPIVLRARIRYRQREAEANVVPLDEGFVKVEFREPQMAITPGQTVVFYDGDVVVGGGTIERSTD